MSELIQDKSDLLRELREAQQQLEEMLELDLENHQLVSNARSGIEKLSRAIALVAAGEGLGECQQDTPYAPLHPVVGPSGELRWCCEHDPQHCKDS